MKYLLLAVAVVLCVSPNALAAAPPMRVAILEFQSASSDAGLEALGKGLQSMVTTDLSKVRAITLIERARLQEIVQEQNLSVSGLIDKKTAAKIGELSGASHLLGGTFTVHGGQMRIDARLFSVKGGEILLAEDITGEKDAFFELEKALISRLIKTLGVSLIPKERAGIARIHTADFDAFQKFSDGIAHFDAKRYQDALDDLREASKIDVDFTLARVTLGEYEALVRKIRGKAQRLELTQRELDRLKADAVARNDALVAQRLVEIAGERGQKSQLRRLAALTYLIGFFDPFGRNHGRIMRFQDHYDGLVIRGRADVLARRYLAEARDLFPKAPLFPDGRHPPKTPQDVDKAIEGMVKALGQGMEHRASNAHRGLLKNLRKVDDFIKLVAVDYRERISLYELAIAKYAELGGEDRDQAGLLEDLSELYLEVGDVDAASAALARMSALTTTPRDLQRLADRIERLGELSALVKRVPKAKYKKLLREALGANGGRISEAFGEELVAGAPSPRLMSTLAGGRRLKTWFSHKDPYWLFGDAPAHLIQGERTVMTGPRTAHNRSKSLRYYRAQEQTAPDVLVALGRTPRDNVDARFTLRFGAPDDYWPKNTPRGIKAVGDLQLDAGRPLVTFVFGLHDIDTKRARDPETRESYYPAPVQGYGVQISDGEVALIRLGERAPADKRIRNVMRREVLKSKKMKASRGVLAVRVIVKGRRVKVSIGGERVTLELPNAEASQGYIGVHIRGQGFVSVESLRLGAP